MDLDKVRQACNSLVESGQSITVTNVRDKLVELYGFAGNNNRLAPFVKLIKSELKKTAKSEDTDLVLSSAINDSVLQSIPGETKIYIDKFVSHLYQSLYDDIESSIASSRIEQLERENTTLRERLKSFQTLEVEAQLMRSQIEQQQKDLIETNRLIDTQKLVQSGKYEADIAHKDTLIDNLTAQISSQASIIEELKSDNKRLTTIIDSVPVNSSVLSDQPFYSVVNSYVSDNKLDKEVAKNTTKLAKFVNYLITYFEDSISS